MLKIFLIDNYDSFVYNLYQYLGELGCEISVFRNDRFSLQDLNAVRPDCIVISPGPGGPQDAGLSVPVIKEFSGKIPILGICLGHQSIGYAFGGKIVRARNIVHGKTSKITHDEKGLFVGIENPVVATRYHSLVVEEESLPREILITAKSEDGEIMGIRHISHPTEGIQFHPESIMTPAGKDILRNFLVIVQKFWSQSKN